MADNSEVIRSFLVSVGVDVDEKGLKRFDQTINKITATVTEFAKEMALAAAAVSAAVVKVSEEFENLYYASQRLNSAVDNIKAFSFGVSQMGGDAKSARASLEGFASFLRSNPMGEGFVRGLGVETRDAAGNAREYADVLRDLGAQLRTMPYWAARQRANLLGIDENTLQALLRGTDIWSDRYRKLVSDSGVDMDQMSKDLTNLMQSFRLLRAQIEIYFYKAVSRVRPEVLRLSVVLAAVGGALALVATFVSPVAAGILALVGVIGLLADDFEGWRKGSESLINWGQWSVEIERAIKAIGDLGLAFGDLLSALEPVASALGGPLGQSINVFISTLVLSLQLLADTIRVIADLLTGQWGKAWADAGKGAKDVITNVTDLLFRSRDAALSWWNAITGRHDGPPPPAPGRPAAPGVSANDNRTPATGGAGAQAEAYFQRQGWTAEQARGIVAGSYAESNLDPTRENPNSGAYGIGQWLGRRVKDFERVMGKPLRGSSLQDQLAFMQWEFNNTERGAAKKIAGQSSSAGALGSFIGGYERPAAGRETTGDISRGLRYLNGARLGGSGGGSTVTINAHTDIKVSGSGDPKTTGKAVGDAVGQQNANLVRNTKTAVR